MTELNPYAKFLDGRPLETILGTTSHEIANKLQMIGPDRTIEAAGTRQMVARGNRLPSRGLRNRLCFPAAPDPCRRSSCPPAFDQEKWAAPYAGFSAKDALAAFTALRNWNLLLIQKTLPASASKAGHPSRTRRHDFPDHRRNHGRSRPQSPRPAQANCHELRVRIQAVLQNCRRERGLASHYRFRAISHSMSEWIFSPMFVML